MSKRVTCVVAALAAAIAPGCSAGPAEPVQTSDVASPDVAAECVDARGPNSTPEQIVEAALAAPVVNPLTGEKETVADAVERAVGRPPQPAQFVDTVFTDIPPDGDAAFAAAVCRLTAWVPPEGSYVWDVRAVPGDRAEVVRIPHLLRSWGRVECSQDTAEWKSARTFRAIEAEIRDARSDAEALKRSLLAEVDKGMFDPGYGNGAMGEAARARARAAVDSLTAEQLIDGVEAWHQLERLALEHLCPQLMAEECGSISPFPDGATTGILEARKVSCDDARLVIRYAYFPFEAPPGSPLTGYKCDEGKDFDSVMLECTPYNEATGEDPHPTIRVVAPG